MLHRTVPYRFVTLAVPQLDLEAEVLLARQHVAAARVALARAKTAQRNGASQVRRR